MISSKWLQVKKEYLTVCLFRWKILCKDSFPCFPMYGSIRKNEKGKLYLVKHKKYNLFLDIVFHYFFFFLGKINLYLNMLNKGS